MTETSPARVTAHHSTTRLEAFSDGVFAIAVTLLALELPVPHANELPEGTHLISVLAAQWPEYAAFVVSFAVIGIMWINHHNLFKLIVRTDHVLMVLNTLLLFGVTVVPYPTRLMADYLNEPDSLTASALYAGTMFLMALLFQLIWRYAVHHRHLLAEHITDKQIGELSRSYNIGFLVYGMALLLSFFSAGLNLLINFALAVFFALPLQNNMVDGD